MKQGVIAIKKYFTKYPIKIRKVVREWRHMNVPEAEISCEAHEEARAEFQRALDGAVYHYEFAKLGLLSVPRWLKTRKID